MKATFCLPAHPSYFDHEYTQEEIEKAIQDYDRMVGGIISKGNSSTKVKHEFMLLRHPGKAVTVIFDSTSYGDGKLVSEVLKEHGIQQYRETSIHDLQIHVNNLKNTLAANRRRVEGESGR